MTGREGALIALAILGCVTTWLIGYYQGEHYGAFNLLQQMGRTYELDAKNADDVTRDQVCDEIRIYKESVARDLDENTQICGWRDWDDPDMGDPDKSD
jgi:hypothetical protein